jgi:hypothetical protein
MAAHACVMAASMVQCITPIAYATSLLAFPTLRENECNASVFSTILFKDLFTTNY